MGQLVTQWLERKFDCRICRLLLQSYELRGIIDSSLDIMYNHAQGRGNTCTLLGPRRISSSNQRPDMVIFLSPDTGDKKERSIELHYSFPESVDTLKSMSLSLPVENARQLLVRYFSHGCCPLIPYACLAIRYSRCFVIPPLVT